MKTSVVNTASACKQHRIVTVFSSTNQSILTRWQWVATASVVVLRAAFKLALSKALYLSTGLLGIHHVALDDKLRYMYMYWHDINSTVGLKHGFSRFFNLEQHRFRLCCARLNKPWPKTLVDALQLSLQWNLNFALYLFDCLKKINCFKK